MNIDDLVVRIRRLPSAKREKLAEWVRSLEEAPDGPHSASLPEQSTIHRGLPPLRGLLRGFGTPPSDEDIDETRRELWAEFPRSDLP